MFNLVIAIVSIALVVAVVLVGSFYGGSGISDATAQAEAARLKNEEQQILAAVEVFNADRGRYPADVEELVSRGYLNSVPRGVETVAQLPQPSIISMAYAAGPDGWHTLVSGQPIYQTANNVPELTCSKYNKLSRGDDGILKQAFTSLQAQCFGTDGDYSIVIVKSVNNAVGLAQALGNGNVQSGNVPEAGSAADWDKVPGGKPSGEAPAPVPAASMTAVLDFGTRLAGTTSNLVATLSNDGAGALSLTAPSASSVSGAGFTFAGTTCGSSLAVGASCDVAVAYSPTAAQSDSGSVTVQTAAGAKVATLTGQKQPSTLTVSIASYDYGAVAVGIKRNITMTVTNTGTRDATNVRWTGQPSIFTTMQSLQTPRCTTTLAAGASCKIFATFAPVTPGFYQGTLTLTSDEGEQAVIPVSGTGVN